MFLLFLKNEPRALAVLRTHNLFPLSNLIPPLIRKRVCITAMWPVKLQYMDVFFASF